MSAATFQIRPRCQRGIAELLHGRQPVDEIEWAGDVELVDWGAVAEQTQDLDLGGPQVHGGRFQVGFELHALQFQPVEVHLRQVACLKAPAIHVEFAVPILQVLPGILLDGLGL